MNDMHEIVTTVHDLARKHGFGADPDDIAQEVLVRVWKTGVRSMDDIQPNPRGWLYRLVKNTSIDAYRKATRRSEVELKEWDDATDDEDVTDADLEARILAEVNRIIATIETDPYRVAAQAYYLMGLSTREIARRLDAPESTVRTRINRARQALDDADHATLIVWDEYQWGRKPSARQRSFVAAAPVGLLATLAKEAWVESVSNG